MRTYRGFNEAISAARLAQLAAKGKGPAAQAKMKADGLSGNVPVGTQKALPPGRVSSNITTTKTGPSTGGGQKEVVGKSTADNAARKRIIDNPRGKEEYDKTDPNNSNKNTQKKQQKKKSSFKDMMTKANKGRKKFGQFYRRHMGAARAQVGDAKAMDGNLNTGSGTKMDRG